MSAFLSGCKRAIYGTRYLYTLELTSPPTVGFDPRELAYRDEVLEIRFGIGRKFVSFRLQNRGGVPLKILWDEAALNIFGTMKRVTHAVVTHAVVRYSDTGTPQPPTTVPAGASIDDQIVPIDNISYSPSRGWQIKDMFFTYDFNDADVRAVIMATIGEHVSVFLPLEISGARKDFTFTFTVKDIQPASPVLELSSLFRRSAGWRCLMLA